MLGDLAELSFDSDQVEVIFAVLDYRIRSPEHKWRCVYKALQVLEYLLRRGSPQCVANAGDLVVPLAALANFQYVGPDGRDYGVNVRLRAAAVKAMILDSEGLAAQRAQLAARAEAGFGSGGLRFAGFSREDMEAAGGVAAPAAAGPAGAAGGQGSCPGGVAAGAAHSGPLAPPLGGTVGPGGMAAPYRPPLFLSAPSSRLGSPTGPSRGAGESKGVTFEANKRQLEQLRQLTLLEGNRLCADCGSGSASARPSWASINLGVFICMRCAGVHRGLGVHVSKVRSTTLDTWLPEQVANMARLGNKRANEHFEANLDPGMRPLRESPHELERFIRLKYVDKVWAAPGPWPPPEEEDAAGAVPGGPAGQTQPAVAATSPAAHRPAAAAAAGGVDFMDSPPSWPSTAPGGASPPATTASDAAAWAPPDWAWQAPEPPGPGPGAGAATAGRAAAGLQRGAGGAQPAPRLQPPPLSPAPAAMAGGAKWISSRPSTSTGAAAPPAAGGGGAAAAGAGGAANGDLLLQLDSDSGGTSDEEGEGERAAAGRHAREGAGDAGFGSGALWDLLDPNLDVITWLQRVESGQRQQQAQQQAQQWAQQWGQQHRAQSQQGQAAGHGQVLQQQQQQQQQQNLPFEPFAAPQGPQQQRQQTPPTPAPSGPVVPPTPAAGAAAAAMASPAYGAGAVSRAVPIAAPAAAVAAHCGGGGSVLSPASSVIVTSEFPVYDLLTPLPTGGGAPPLPAAVRPACASGAAALPAAAGTATATVLATASARATPFGSPSLGPLAPNGGGAAGAGLRAGSQAGFAAGVAAPSPPPAAAASAPSAGAGDLDNLLAQQLDSLGSSLAGGGKAGKAAWLPAGGLRAAVAKGPAGGGMAGGGGRDRKGYVPL